MTRIVRVQEFGGPDVLRIDEVDLGGLKPGEVRLKVAAIGLNRVDALFRSGQFGNPPVPAMIGYEAAGTVEALGANVKGFAVGDKVAIIPAPFMGTYGEAIHYPADYLVKIPGGLSFEAAAATWMQYLTAYALIELTQIRAGDSVAITAASSSVGLAAIQIANAVDAVPIAVTRGKAKRDALVGHGARHVVVMEEQDTAEGIRRVTNGRGARVIFDAVSGSTFPSLVDAAAPEGAIIVYGALDHSNTLLPVHLAMMKHLMIHGFTTRYVIDDAQRRAKAVDFVLRGLANRKFNPVIDRVFAFNDIADAHRYLEGNAQVGKIVMRVP
jgi:NADPH:quinone reductase-like Zn-dependent oxidoreductase